MIKTTTLQRNFISLSRIACALTIVIPCLAFFSWTLNIAALKTTFPTLPFMLPNLALTFVMAGISLWLLVCPEKFNFQHIVGQGLAFMVTLVSAITLSDYLFRESHKPNYLWVDALLSNASLPGEPSTHTAIMFFLVGLSLLFLNSRKPNYIFFGQFIILIATVLVSAMIVDYVGTLRYLNDIFIQSGMTIASSVIFLLLCMGVLLAVPDHGLMAVYSSKTMGGIMLRRVIPFTIAVPFLLGWLRGLAERSAYFDTSFSVTLMIYLIVVVVNLIICWNAKMLYTLDRDRQKASDALKNANASLEAEVQSRTYELRSMNDKLKEEIREKKQREKEISDFLTERKMTGADLLKFANIIESSNDAIIGMTLQGVITSWNRGAEEVFGYFAGEVIGQNISILMSKERYFEMDQIYQKVARGEGIKHYETVRIRKDTTHIHVSLTISAICDAEGKVVGASAIARDVTEKKRVDKILEQQRKELEKSNHELDSFVYTASHDLRAPLRTMSSFAGFLEEDYQDKLDDKGKEYLLKIRKGAARMSKLIDDLLTLSQISRMQNPFEDVDIHSVIDQAMERLEFDIQKFHVKIAVDNHIPIVHCDRIKIAEVFVNLIHNAVKFSSKNPNPQPLVEVGYRDQGTAHEFFVKDNGIGIDPEYHEQIFQFLRRLHTVQEYEGSGAGLSIVKRIVDDHNGHIWIQSKLGEGASFHFTIPKGLKGKKKLGEILVDEGLIDEEKLKEVLERQMSGETDDAPAHPHKITKDGQHHA